MSESGATFLSEMASFASRPTRQRSTASRRSAGGDGSTPKRQKQSAVRCCPCTRDQRCSSRPGKGKSLCPCVHQRKPCTCCGPGSRCQNKGVQLPDARRGQTVNTRYASAVEAMVRDVGQRAAQVVGAAPPAPAAVAAAGAPAGDDGDDSSSLSSRETDPDAADAAAAGGRS